MSCGCGKKAVVTPEQLQASAVTLEDLARQAELIAERQRRSQENALANARS